jgi:hypothetical protein
MSRFGLLPGLLGPSWWGVAAWLDGETSGATVGSGRRARVPEGKSVFFRDWFGRRSEAAAETAEPADRPPEPEPSAPAAVPMPEAEASHLAYYRSLSATLREGALAASALLASAARAAETAEAMLEQVYRERARAEHRAASLRAEVERLQADVSRLGGACDAESRRLADLETRRTELERQLLEMEERRERLRRELGEIVELLRQRAALETGPSPPAVPAEAPLEPPAPPPSTDASG